MCKNPGLWPSYPHAFSKANYMAAETPNIDEKLYNYMENSSLTTNQNIL